jgi:two-component system osmolarity sensor histidine kinase EnvZ
VSITLDLPDSLKVPARALSLRRALANLIDNALRYGGPLGPLEVRVYPDGGDACIEVADRGPGIPADQIERLRRPFARLEEARSNTKGAGLGLAIVERAMRAHHGRLDLLPREGGGLRAVLCLPARANTLGRARMRGAPVASGAE